MLVTIKSNNQQATIDTHGAQLISLMKDGEEYIWQRDKRYWGECAPILFPMVSAVLNKRYTYEGNTYQLPRHGFARDCVYDVVEQSKFSVTMRLVQNHITEIIYPFEFDFFVTFEFLGDKLDIYYTVKNVSDTKDMYFNTGSHEGYNLLDGTSIDEHYIEFEKKEELLQMIMDKPFWDGETHDFGETDILELKEEYFAIDGVFFIDIKSDYVTLKSKSSNKAIRVYFNCDKLGFYKKPKAQYICIEPWDGFCPYEGDSNDLSEKRFVKKLPPKSEYKFYHGIEIM